MLFNNISIIDENYYIQENMNIVTEGEKIVYVGKEAPLDYKGEIYKGKNKLASPGFFNTHCHVPMTLLRGYGEGLPLHKWLFERIFPFEAKLKKEDIYYGTLLGAIELIKSGVVSFTDMYFEIEEMYRALEKTGIKANISHGTSGDDSIIFKEIKAYEDTDRLVKILKDSSNDRVKVDMGLHAEYTSSESLVKQLVEYAKENNLIVHTHISETKNEHELCKEKYGMTPVAYFEKCGLFDQPVVAAHCVYVEKEDFDILQSKGATVAHCISSNLKLGSGFAPVKKMIEKNINITVGTDGASSNNNLNMLEEIHLATIVNKGINQDSEFMTPRQIYKIATRNGAKAQGRIDCGSLKVGNKADIIVFDLDKPHLQPVHDLLANIVFSAQSEDICFSMIDGNIVYQNGEIKNLDIERIIFEANKISKRIVTELNI